MYKNIANIKSIPILCGKSIGNRYFMTEEVSVILILVLFLDATKPHIFRIDNVA